VSRDVVFHESNGWNWTLDTNEQYKGIVIKFEEVETNEEKNVESNNAESTFIALSRSQSDSHIPSWFIGFEMTSYVDINEEGDIICFVLFSKSKPITFEEAITNNK